METGGIVFHKLPMQPFPQLPRAVSTTCLGMVAIAGNLLLSTSAPAASPEFALSPATSEALVEYCFDCHDGEMKKGGLDIEHFDFKDLSKNSAHWEDIVRKINARHMPPVGKDRPDEVLYQKLVDELSTKLDRAAEANPNPGRTETLRRLNRTEYQNAIRDLLALDIDAAAMLPKDDAGHGFDNVTVGSLSPTLLDRYITAAQTISRLAVGAVRKSPGGETFRLPADLTQEKQMEGLPVGTRGGALFHHYFSRDGEYEVTIRLARDRNEEIEGLRGRHELEVSLDRERIELFTVEPPAIAKDFESVDNQLKLRFNATAGPHELGVTFLENSFSLIENKRQPLEAHFNMHRHPRLSPAIYQVSVNGPFESTGPGDTPSRRQIFISTPKSADEEPGCAETILTKLMRHAYRRPVTDEDLIKPMEFFYYGREEGGFDAGIETALSAVLMNPEFLFRVENDPAGVAPGDVYRISDIQLASRLSFFLWGSIPDDELLDLAIANELHPPEVLDQQVLRMLADPRSENLVNNFAAQWLYLRNLDSITPDLRLFPDFDDNLRQAMRTETELFFASVMNEDRSVLDLITADYTFLNERLAKHYDIPHIYGSHFRRVDLGENGPRGGLLRQASILTVTSYATRTSPVIRGHWILGNLLGTPPPPPPPDVSALEENNVSASLPMRARLAKHRANAACASCHNLMDPVGFAFENYDATGRWRTMEDGVPVDASGGLPDGSEFVGVAGLEAGIERQPDLFVGTFTEKLLTFALGRGIESYDAPAVRKIVRDAGANDYRFSSVILGVVHSRPFTMRKAP